MFVITSCKRNGKAQYDFIFRFGQYFGSKYEVREALNAFFGVKIADIDLASEFGEDGDEVYLYPDYGFDLKGHYEEVGIDYGITHGIDL